MRLRTSGRALASSRRLRTRTLLRSFGLLALAVVVAIGVVLGAVLQSTVRGRAIDDAARTAEVAVGVGVLPLLTAEDLQRGFMPLDGQRVADIDRVLGPSLSPNGIARIKVWNREHWLVYSDNPNLIGRWFAGTDPLEQAFLGEVTSEITDLTAPEEREERSFGELLSVYVPLGLTTNGTLSTDPSDDIIGAFEIYLPYAPIASDIQRDTYRLYAALAAGLLALYLVLFRLVSRASRTIGRQGAENLRRATTDELTGLANRERFHDRLNEMIVQSVDPSDPISLLLFDVDGFQAINDTLGHDRGDLVLREIAARLNAQVRTVDLVARLGGDEFGVILGHEIDGDSHRTVADRLLCTFNAPIEIDGIQLDVRCSVGVSTFPVDGHDAAELLRRADIAMYSAKRDQTVIEDYRPALDHFSAEALELVGEVRAGIERGEFWLAYQPQMAVRTGKLVGVEALVRWAHPQRGFVPPGSFIPTLETLPACRALTDHVIELALRQLAAWRSVGHTHTVAVNLSARDASDPQLPEMIASKLRQYGVPASSLHLELTEGTALANPGRTRAVLGDLRALGCEVAIDDFGTGFASLSYLISLPITALKIDRSFVNRIGGDARSAAIVKHSIELGHALGLTVVAEGIEDRETLERLFHLGCDVAQGYLLGKPVAASDLSFTAPPAALLVGAHR